MPMYDYNGTTYTALGKAYDYNGTTYSELGMGYDYNGTSYTLLFSSDFELVPGTSSTLTFNNTSYSAASLNSSGTVWLSANANNNETYYSYGMMRSTSPIDFSQYSTLTVTGTAYKYDGYDTRGHIRIAGKTTAQDYISGYASSNSGTVCEESWGWGAHSLMTTGGTNTFTKTYDISSVTGSYYLYIWCAAYAWMTTNATITSVKFE